MLDEVVVVVGSDERREFCDGGEPVQVFLVAEECFPFVVAFAPAGCPQGDEIAVGESEFDRDDVSSHGRKPIEPKRAALFGPPPTVPDSGAVNAEFSVATTSDRCSPAFWAACWQAQMISWPTSAGEWDVHVLRQREPDQGAVIVDLDADRAVLGGEATAHILEVVERGLQGLEFVRRRGDEGIHFRAHTVSLAVLAVLAVCAIFPGDAAFMLCLSAV